MKHSAIMTRPLTAAMLETLMDCHERELLNLGAYDAATVPCVSGLLKRGVITTRTYMDKKGKKIVGVYVTNMGKAYLKNI